MGLVSMPIFYGPFGARLLRGSVDVVEIGPPTCVVAALARISRSAR